MMPRPFDNPFNPDADADNSNAGQMAEAFGMDKVGHPVQVEHTLLEPVRACTLGHPARS